MIVVISNCQTAGIASAVHSLLPQHEVRHFHVGHPDLFTPGEVVDAVRQADACLSLPLGSEWGEMEITNLESRGNVRRFPSFIFTGFHPDCILAWRSPGHYIPSPMVYHSLIIASGYCLGYSEGRVAGLFCEDIFAAFGYKEAFVQSLSALSNVWNEVGLDVSPLVERWLARGVFCYTINHPKSYVITSLAYKILKDT